MNRYQEWQALMAYAREELDKHPPVGGISGLPDLDNLPIECLGLGGEINTIERARTINWCLQRHWQNMRRLGGAE